nr:aldehyde ferredoxin oxidoreductase N-terminal domain-containing protein [Candidatus Njordarchaeota archaeon]
MRVLRIDLGERNFSREEIDENVVNVFIGGKGLGAWFLLDEVDEKVEPLSPRNMLIFAVGPATGTRFPTAN